MYDKISVIVPAHNAAGTIGECLAALCDQVVGPTGCEIIVVDDGSTDGTAEIARRFGVRVLCQPRQGPAAARNRGVQAARGEVVLFTDADCAPTPDWVQEITKPLADPEIVGVKGTYRTRQRELVARFVQIEYEDKYDRLARAASIDFIDTHSAAYRRDVCLANGGFDTAFPTASVEDQEFSFRLARRGYKLVFAPRAQVYHQHATSPWEYACRKFTIGYWKALLIQWHPERLVRDSHTPQVLKAQMVLLALAGLSLLAAPLWPTALWGAGGLAALFLASTLPFVVKAARKDALVAVISPFMLALRAGALGAGFALGTLHFTGRRMARQPVLNARQRAIKRSIDIVGALAGLLLLLPGIPLIALLIKLDSQGPVFYVQARVGEGGRVFRMLKFRSMVAGADEMVDELVDLETLPAPAFKLKEDPRVTRVGRVLRRTSLDELPQLWNVLKGDMSLVGPRPEEVGMVQRYNAWHRQRLAVKPGLTGPVQINGRADLSLDERIRLELDYIEHYSLGRDFMILLRTVPAVLSGRGAY